VSKQWGSVQIYIKKEWESDPFIKKIYIPNCLLVGHRHIIKQIIPELIVEDNFEYPDEEISDEEFSKLRSQKQDVRVVS
jgi:hypothetical protein